MLKQNYIVKPKKNFTGNISVPGDKSIAHRLVLLSLLLDGKFTISNMPTGQDVQTSLSVVKQLGVKIAKNSDNTITLSNNYSKQNDENALISDSCQANFPNDMNSEAIILDCQNSGTTARLIAGILAGKPSKYIITGDASLQKRPMNRIIEPLLQMGIAISALGTNNTLPMQMSTLDMPIPIDYSLPIASAQVKSAILLSALATNGKNTIFEPRKSRDHTEKLLQYFGAQISFIDKLIEIEGPFSIKGNYSFCIPNDPSSAAYFVVGSLITENSSISLNDILFNPTRTEYLNVLKQMGANIKIENSSSLYCEPTVNLEVKTSQLKGIEIDANKVPLLIDELPILAIAMSFAHGKSKVTGASELRYKETDRISNLLVELKKFGVNCCELDDGFEIFGPKLPTHPTEIDSHKDHRLAMSMAIMSGKLKKNVTILNGDCVEISFPNFYNLLA